MCYVINFKLEDNRITLLLEGNQVEEIISYESNQMFFNIDMTKSKYKIPHFKYEPDNIQRTNDQDCIHWLSISETSKKLIQSDLIVYKIREKYSVDEEFSILRKQMTGVDSSEFGVYNTYVESIKENIKSLTEEELWINTPKI